MTVLAWHFGGALMRDGRPFPPDGEKLVHTGRLVMCESGLHGSERIIDALKYATGNMIFRTLHSGEIRLDTDKLVSSERTILWRIDGETVLREFARWAALQVVDLWDAPEIVRQYLETGDESISAAASAAAWDAAMDASAAAWGAAMDASAARGAIAAAIDAWDAACAAQNETLTELVEAAHGRTK